MFDAIGFDADDTLWHNERLFSMTQEKFGGILKEHARIWWIVNFGYREEEPAGFSDTGLKVSCFP
ncbi:MAG: hypothetical protein Ct9H90mP8_3230 [Pseudomonadota bacterium]|nr:MAG: hypothetical protein Ct9H90mP8_3230 [Pseudomonadota bacterium]